MIAHTFSPSSPTEFGEATSVVPTNPPPTMTWLFQTEHDALNGNTPWTDLVLAPLTLMAACNGWEEREERVVLNVAWSRGLLPAGSDALTTSERALSRLRQSPTLCHRAERHLAALLSRLPAERSRLLADRLYDALLAIAQASPAPGAVGSSIDHAEQAELKRVFHLLRIARKKPVSPPVIVPVQAAVGDRSVPDVRLPASRAEYRTEVSPWTWAAGWDSAMADRAFEILADMHGAHEAERERGAGRLDTIIRLEDALRAADVRTWCDHGVTVPPSSWGEMTIWLIGDLHGDAEALERSLARIGTSRDGGEGGSDRLPPDTAVVFLGDLGDRGPGTLAVWLRVAALKARHPDRVQILRGNHEETQEVRLARADGSLLTTRWAIPTTTNMEAYLTLALALRGSLENLAMIFDHLPDAVVLPGGWLAVHGALPPRWKENDGWPGDAGEAGRDALRIEGVRDLRKDEVRALLRWTDAVDRPEVDFGWAGHARRSRLFTSAADHAHWCGLLGDFRLVHGHTHPAEGGRFEWEGRGLALNTSRHTAPRQSIARWRKGSLDLHDLTAASPGPPPLN